MTARLEEVTAQKEEVTSELQGAASATAAELESLTQAQAEMQVRLASLWMSGLMMLIATDLAFLRLTAPRQDC